MRKAGEVTYGAAHDGEVGKNRGIVCFERKKDAERAVDDLDGRELNGRTVSIYPPFCAPFMYRSKHIFDRNSSD